jgi:hypothetical protein
MTESCNPVKMLLDAKDGAKSIQRSPSRMAECNKPDSIWIDGYRTIILAMPVEVCNLADATDKFISNKIARLQGALSANGRDPSIAVFRWTSTKYRSISRCMYVYRIFGQHMKEYS